MPSFVSSQEENDDTALKEIIDNIETERLEEQETGVEDPIIDFEPAPDCQGVTEQPTANATSENVGAGSEGKGNGTGVEEGAPAAEEAAKTLAPEQPNYALWAVGVAFVVLVAFWLGRKSQKS